MVVDSLAEVEAATLSEQNYDRISDETKAGVKGLVDAGITKVPGCFIPA